MIPRYSRPEMARLWCDENRFATWLEVELAVTEVLTGRGEVPAEALEAIRKRPASTSRESRRSSARSSTT